MTHSHRPRRAWPGRPAASAVALAGTGLVLLLSLVACGGRSVGDPHAVQPGTGAPGGYASAGSDAGSDPDAALRVVWEVLGLVAAVDGQIVDPYCGAVTPEIHWMDLDGDGVDEVVVDYGNSCTSGGAGRSVAVFRRGVDLVPRTVLHLPGLLVEVRPTTGSAFPELVIGGPGFCFGVWAWNGERYDHARNEPQAPGGCGSGQASSSGPRSGWIHAPVQLSFDCSRTRSTAASSLVRSIGLRRAALAP